MTAAVEAPVIMEQPGQSSNAPALAAESCYCGAAFVADAAFCLRCGSRRGAPQVPVLQMPEQGLSPRTCASPRQCHSPRQALSPRQWQWPGPGQGPPIGYGAGGMPYEQVAPSVAGPPWYPQGGMMPPAGTQFPWPQQMMPPPYGQPQYYPGGDYGNAIAMQMAMQACSPRMEPGSPRFSENPQAAYGPGVSGAPPGAEADPKKESLLPCRPCRWSCKNRCKRPSTKGGEKCKGWIARIPSATAIGSGFRNVVRSACGPCVDAPVVKSGRWRLWLMVLIGVAALASLLAALLDDAPHLLAAGLAAVLGWLAVYAYMLQLDCWRLARNVDSDSLRQPDGKEGGDLSLNAVAADGMDLDVTVLAKSLGSPFCNPTSGGQGKEGQTMQTVLTSALVNEYLRCASQLKKYQHKHGVLPNAPVCNPDFADALLTGLHGSTASANGPFSSRSSDVPSDAPASSAATRGEGTPNFADRLAAVNAEGITGPKSPVPPLGAGTGLAELLAQGDGSNSPTASSTPPQPPAGELSRCHTIEQLAPSAEASPDGSAIKGVAARSSARMEDMDSSINDPPWLRAIRHVN